MDERLKALTEEEQGLIRDIPKDVTDTWFLLYPDSAWVVKTIREAILYWKLRDKGFPTTWKQWARAITSSLSRSKSWLKTNGPSAPTINTAPKTIEQIDREYDQRMVTTKPPTTR